MEMTTDSIGQHNKYVTVINDNGDSYKINIGLHRGDIEPEEALFDVRQWMYPIRPDFDKSDLKEWHQKMDEWIADGCKIAEVSKEIPAVEAKDAVYEDVEVSPAGERQKVVVTEVEEEVTSTVIEKNSSGKYIEKEVTETVTKSSEEPQFEEVPLYHANGQPKNDDDGNPVMHKIPLMEEYEAVTERRLVSAAVEAKEAEQIIISPEKAIEKKAWVDSH